MASLLRSGAINGHAGVVECTVTSGLLNATGDTEMLSMQRLEGSGAPRNDASELIQFYKVRVKALMKSLLAAEEKNVELMREIIRLNELVEPDRLNPIVITSAPTSARVTPLPAPPNPLDLTTRYLDDLRSISNAYKPHSAPVYSTTSNTTVDTPQASKPSSKTGLDPRSAPFTPQHHHSATSSEATQPALKPSSARPEEPPLTITPPKRSHTTMPPQTPSQSFDGAAKEIVAKDETLAQNLRKTSERLASQHSSPLEDGEIRVSREQRLQDSITSQWLDEQMYAPARTSMLAGNVTPTVKANRLIDFSSPENGPSPANKHLTFGANANANMSGIPELQSSVPQSPKRLQENVKPGLQLVTSVSPKTHRESQVSSSLGSPTSRAAALPQVKGTPLLVPEKLKVYPKPLLTPNDPAFKGRYFAQMAAFASKWSSTKANGSNAGSQAESLAPNTRAVSPVQNEWDAANAAVDTRTISTKFQASAEEECEQRAPSVADTKSRNDLGTGTVKPQTQAMSKEELAHLFSNNRKEVEEPKRQPNFLKGNSDFPTALFHYNDPTPPLSPLTKNGYDYSEPLINEQSSVDSSDEAGFISGTRVLGAMLDDACKAMVLKDDAWELKLQLARAQVKAFCDAKLAGVQSSTFSNFVDVRGLVWQKVASWEADRFGDIFVLEDMPVMDWKMQIPANFKEKNAWQRSASAKTASQGHIGTTPPWGLGAYGRAPPKSQSRSMRTPKHEETVRSSAEPSQSRPDDDGGVQINTQAMEVEEREEGEITP